jgi:hypothetical protein
MQCVYYFVESRNKVKPNLREEFDESMGLGCVAQKFVS